MRRILVVDTTLLVLLVVGRANKSFIAKHKRLQDYTIQDFDLLELLIADSAELVLLPHVLTEVSNLSRRINPPDQTVVSRALRAMVLSYPEIRIESANGVRREEFSRLGLTDAMLLSLCVMEFGGIAPTLVTADVRLAYQARALGLDVIDYRQDFQTA